MCRTGTLDGPYLHFFEFIKNYPPPIIIHRNKHPEASIEDAKRLKESQILLGSNKGQILFWADPKKYGIWVSCEDGFPKKEGVDLEMLFEVCIVPSEGDEEIYPNHTEEGVDRGLYWIAYWNGESFQIIWPEYDEFLDYDFKKLTSNTYKVTHWKRVSIEKVPFIKYFSPSGNSIKSKNVPRLDTKI